MDDNIVGNNIVDNTNKCNSDNTARIQLSRKVSCKKEKFLVRTYQQILRYKIRKI